MGSVTYMMMPHTHMYHQFTRAQINKIIYVAIMCIEPFEYFFSHSLNDYEVEEVQHKVLALARIPNGFQP
jgi:hypothetical protein